MVTTLPPVSAAAAPMTQLVAPNPLPSSRQVRSRLETMHS